MEHDIAGLERVRPPVARELAAKGDDVLHKVVGHVHDELRRLWLNGLPAVNLLQQRHHALQRKNLQGRRRGRR